MPARTVEAPQSPPRSSVGPAIAAGLTGFVLGVVLTLIVTGTLMHSSPRTAAPPPATLPPATPTADARLKLEIKRIVAGQLGPSYPNPKRPRLVAVTVLPPAAFVGPPPSRHGDYDSVSIVYNVNGHPLGPAWRLREAKGDVFRVLKALYTSQLPIGDVEMKGRFPLKQGKHTHWRVVLVAYLDRSKAAKIPWKHWTRADESRLWTNLTYKYLNPKFS